jgi:hypothetical protein
MHESIMHLHNEALLDNPIWGSLTTGHAHLAMAHGLARRYPSDIGPLSALREPTSEAYADLASIVPDGDVAVLLLDNEPALPKDWELVRGGGIVQMVCSTIPSQPRCAERIVPMTASDIPDMVALATLTEPGPFRSRTAALGGFIGIRVSGRLAAMAGQRLLPDGFSEVSAVCTHPDFRGRGYAQALVAAITQHIQASRRIPFLTSFEANEGAIRIYRQVGFILRRSFRLAVLKPPNTATRK